MFNNEIKSRYIEEKNFYTILPKNYLEHQFAKLEKYELEKGKDVCCFTVREIREYYKILNLSSLEMIACLNSQLSQYTQWCLQNNLVIDNQNHFLEIDLITMKSCLNPIKLNNKIVSREILINWCNQLPNPKDRFALLGLFEGLKGKDFTEITKLKPENIDGNVLTLSSGRKIKVSNELISYIRDTIEESIYYPCVNKSGSIDKFYNLVDFGYVIKYYQNVHEEPNDFQKGRILYSGIRRSLMYIGVFGNTTTSGISDSGKIHMIKERSNELGITPIDYLYSSHINEIEKQFNCRIVRSSFSLKYGNHLKN